MVLVQYGRPPFVSGEDVATVPIPEPPADVLSTPSHSPEPPVMATQKSLHDVPVTPPKLSVWNVEDAREIIPPVNWLSADHVFGDVVAGYSPAIAFRAVVVPRAVVQ